MWVYIFPILVAFAIYAAVAWLVDRVDRALDAAAQRRRRRP